MLTPEQIADEEARAALWREQVARRVAFQTGLWGRLAGSPQAYAAFLARWEAVILWLTERQEPIVDPEDDYEHDPLQLSEQVNVGRPSREH